MLRSNPEGPRNWQLGALKALYRLFPFPLQGDACLDGSTVCLPLSVVLPTHARPQGQLPFAPLETCLASLAEQEISPEWFEVIVVEDGPLSSRIPETIETFARELPIRLIRSGDSHEPLGRLRNLGIEASRGRWILIMDDDTLLAAGFLLAFISLAEHLDPERDIVLPRGTARYGLLHPRYDFLKPYQLATQCIVYPRTLLKKIGGFHSVDFIEDIDLALRAYLSGGQIRKTEQLHFFHPPSYFCLQDPTTRRRGLVYGRAYRDLKRFYSMPVWVAFVMRDVVELRHLLFSSAPGERSSAALALYTLRALFTSSERAS